MSGLREVKSVGHYLQHEELKKAVRLLREGNVFGASRKGVDIWPNVSQHCAKQIDVVLALGENMGREEKSLQEMIFATFIHDYDKQYQVGVLREVLEYYGEGFLTPELTGRLQYKAFEESEYHSQEGMRRRGVPERIIQIASADGHPALPDIMRRTVEEKIINYAGTITDGIIIVSPEKRIKKLASNQNYAMMNEYGRRLSWTAGKTLYEVQGMIALELAEEFVGKIEKHTGKKVDPEGLPEFLNERITERNAILKQRIRR